MAEESDLQDVPLETPESDTSPALPASSNSGPGNDAGAGVVTNGHASGDNSSHKSSDGDRKPTIAERVACHSPNTLNRLTYLEMLMADGTESVSDRDVVDAVLDVVSYEPSHQSLRLNFRGYVMVVIS